ncbi:MAG: hypothetical protein GMKNLPBB_02849 [Myxococcota bacterium]|nr:hypothetical protein [Myxococcota bacterium]
MATAPKSAPPARARRTSSKTSAKNTRFQEVLRSLPFARELNATELNEISSICTEVLLKRHEYLFRDGDTGDAFYVLEEGLLEVVKATGDDQTEHLLASLTPRCVVGEMAIISRATRSASIRAGAPSLLVRVDARQFHKLLDEGNIAAYRMILGFAQVLSNRLQLMDKKLVEMLHKQKEDEGLQEFAKFKARLERDWSLDDI